MKMPNSVKQELDFKLVDAIMGETLTHTGNELYSYALECLINMAAEELGVVETLDKYEDGWDFWYEIGQEYFLK